MKAIAGEWAYSYEVFRDEMEKVAREHPHSKILCISPRNDICFCGYLPSNPDGSIIELIPDERAFLMRPVRYVS